MCFVSVCGCFIFSSVYLVFMGMKLIVSSSRSSYVNLLNYSWIDPMCIQILSFGGDDVFTMDLTLHNEATAGQKYLDVHAFDIEVSLQTGCMKVVFLNKFVQDLLVGIVNVNMNMHERFLMHHSILLHWCPFSQATGINMRLSFLLCVGDLWHLWLVDEKGRTSSV